MGLTGGVVDVHRRQFLNVVFRDVELNSVRNAHHCADRDRHFPFAPEVSLLEQHVRDVMVAGVDDESLDFPDIAIRRVNVLAAAHGDLAERDGVVGDGL